MSANAVESNCDALGSLFAAIVNDMKDSWPAFEDLANKTTKLHSSLRTTILAAASFLDSFQKVADIATNARGATKDIGKALTRLCIRHKSIESKLKVITSAMMESLVGPMQEKVEDWKKSVVQLDKDHARDQKKAWQDIKKASSETVRLQKKAKKGKTTYSKGEAKEKLECAMQNLNSKYVQLEEAEKRGIRQALIEERQHYCHFITCIEPLVKAEVSLVGEAAHLQEILDSLCSQAADPDNLPEASERVITEIKGRDVTFPYRADATPPDSPSGLARSRKSSVSSGDDDSSQASTSEADSAIGSSPKHSANGLKLQIPRGSTGLMSIASQDSGFTSQDTLCYRSVVPATTAAAVAMSTTSDSSCFHRKENPDIISSHSKASGPHSDGDSYATLRPAAAYDGSGSQLSYQQASPASPTSLDWLPPADRPHTVSGAGSGHYSRPALQADTFLPPSQLVTKQSLSTEYVGQSSRQEKAVGLTLASLPASVPALPTASLAGMPPKPMKPGMQLGGSVRVLPQPPARLMTMKAKPIAIPVPPALAAPEPVYMNPQELGTRTNQPPEAECPSTAAVVSGSSSSSVAANAEVRASVALADAIRELEASTAALQAFADSSSSPVPIDDRGCQGHESDVLDESHSSGTGRGIAAYAQPCDYDVFRTSQGDPVMTWAGQAVLRRQSQRPPPPPPTRTSSAPVFVGQLSSQGSEAVDSASLDLEPAVSIALFASSLDSRDQALPPPPPPPLEPAEASSEAHQLVLPPAGWRADLKVSTDYEDMLPPPPPPLQSPPPPPPPQSLPPASQPYRPHPAQLLSMPVTLTMPPPPSHYHLPSMTLPPQLASPPLPSPPPPTATSGVGADPAMAHVSSVDRNSHPKGVPPAVAQKPRNKGIQQQPIVFGASSAPAANTGQRASLVDSRQQQKDDAAAAAAKTASVHRLSAAQVSPDFVASLNAKLSGPVVPMAARGKERGLPDS